MKHPLPVPRTAARLPLCLTGEEGFEGPLDALLALLDGQPDRILQVPVAELTEQYLAWLESAQDRGLAEQVEFVETAVSLIRLKTEVLLQQWGCTEEEQAAPESALANREKDPREDLRRQLQAHQEQLVRWRDSLQEAARELGSGFFGGAASLPRGRDLQAEEKRQATATELLVRIREARRLYAKRFPGIEIEHEPLTEARLADWLGEQLEERGEPVDFETLLEAQELPGEGCLLFLALLQGCKAAKWTVRQAEAFGVIQVDLRTLSS